MSWLAHALHEHFALEAIGTVGCGHSKDEPEIHVAEFIRDQLRTDEAVERAARAVFDGEYSGAWDDAAEWMREDCRIAARAAITALLGEEP